MFACFFYWVKPNIALAALCSSNRISEGIILGYLFYDSSSASMNRLGFLLIIGSYLI
jgi:hypothetical protein